ncbi:hypothetical protein BSPWISOXPB_9441 [uncultured Gammaproteobacteria bacterium]|nr:hypothetical protein BSPWISOXPB_9441 [uncultured Gammaproteobacteria bacterium]
MQVGDEINVLMAACAWNLRKWLVIALFFFLAKTGFIFCKMPKVFWYWIKAVLLI